ncbi:DUF4097 family beta strand repeat-containing protein [Cohnella algarum]|uniref:DUF4097 family beta strand repeat-containing protein n=1 Tax=Cohnella algarum TaxID=2044859 RepID=UPI0019676D4B|nr:DUF4097 family beta strand repeat-containing protein [Cohnella algarum]MBN2981073.1 DUF4097 family beta strand repeat protein [Cohnella algarum]
MIKAKIVQGAVLAALLLLTAACGAKEPSAATPAENLELQADGLTKLVIDHRNGDIRIAGSADTDKIEVVPLVRAGGADMDKLELSLEQQEDAAYLKAQFKAQFLAMGSGSVDLEIRVPEQLELEIRSHRDGHIRLSDLSSGAKIDNVNGDIQVSGLSGPLEIENRDGDVTVADIGSDVTIRNLNGHLQIDRVGGSARIDVGDGSLEIDHVEKDVTVTQSGNGDIAIGEVGGQIFRKN